MTGVVGQPKMTYVSFLGGLMTTFSLPVVTLLLSVTKYPFLVLIYLVGAFFWIAGALVKASLWMGFQDSTWGTVVTGVVVDGGMRVLFAWTYLKIRPKLLLLMDKGHRGDIQKTMNFRSAGLVGGLGYGTIQAITLYGLVLSEATGPATYYLASCPNVSIFLLQSIVALAFLVMAVFLQYAAMHALYFQQWLHLIAVVGFHALASFCSVASSSLTPGMCSVSVLGAIVGAVGSCAYSACVLHRKGAEDATGSKYSTSTKLL